MIPLGLAGQELPDGPVTFWIAVFAADGTMMGAARASRPPAWQWRDGHLCLAYGEVTVRVINPGWYDHGVICAVSGIARAWAPVWKIGLGRPEQLRAGDHIHILDGVVVINPENAPG